MPEALQILTEKEKQTLRLIVRGHDAKSIARHLGLSVHTVNERLRNARRKLALPSSRAAARALLEHEGGTPDSFGDDRIGDAPAAATANKADGNRRRILRLAGIAAGALVMIVTLATLFAAVQPPSRPARDAPAPALTATLAAGETEAATQTAAQTAAAARAFLVLLDEGRWDDSYAATGTAFRTLNSAQTWADISRRVRTPLGAVVGRDLLGQEYLPAPPRGYQVVKFRTRFANRADAIETVTLEREAGTWRVVGITVM